MSNITSEKYYDLFIQEARFFYCQDIYEGDWEGKEKYIVASDTPEKELWGKYPAIMKKLSPYMFCDSASGEVFAESAKNISKFKKRAKKTMSFGEIEILENMVAEEDLESEFMLLIKEGLSVCTPIQRERILKYYIEGMTLDEIAEGKSRSAVIQSIESGIKKIQIFYGINLNK